LRDCNITLIYRFDFNSIKGALRRHLEGNGKSNEVLNR